MIAGHEKNRERIYVYLSSSTRQALDEAAARARRDRSSYVRLLVEAKLAKVARVRA